MRRRDISACRRYSASLGEQRTVSHPPLKFLHGESSLNEVKLAQFRRLATDQIILSLAPGQPSSLKARPDGTLIEGHHRTTVLRERDVDIDSLPREIVPKIHE